MEDGPLRPQQCNSEALSWSKSLLHTRHWPLAPAGIRKARPRGRAGSNRYRRLDFHRQTPPVAANATDTVIRTEVPRFFSRAVCARRGTQSRNLFELAHHHVRTFVSISSTLSFRAKSRVFSSPRGLCATRDAVEESLFEFAAPPRPHVRQHSFVGTAPGPQRAVFACWGGACCARQTCLATSSPSAQALVAPPSWRRIFRPLQGHDTASLAGRSEKVHTTRFLQHAPHQA